MGKRSKFVFAGLAILVSGEGWASASTLQFDLLGKAGSGLLSGNENHAINGVAGTGGERGAGIVYDDVTNVLSINIGWGTANGFTNLTGNASAGHIHGPTASAGAASFTENAGVAIGLDSQSGWDNNASSGGFLGSVTLPTQALEDALLAGRLYLNFHTASNGPGEIRGNIVVPEPTLAGVTMLGGLAAMARRHRRRPV